MWMILIFVYIFLTYCFLSYTLCANAKIQLSPIPILRGHILFLLNTFFLVLVQKSSVMSDSLLSPLLDEQH